MNRNQKLFLVLLVASLLGLYAAFGLMLDKISLLQNKPFIFACSINPLFSCIQVMQTPYADLFGFPNPIFGLIGYSSMATLGFAVLLEGGKLSKKVLLFGLVSALAAFLFSYYLLGVSMFLISALCPLCLLSLAASTLIFWLLLYLNLEQNTLGKRLAASKAVKTLLRPRNYVLLVAVWFLLVGIALYVRFPVILKF
jgi:uncharacterized membrane protein